MYFMMKLKILQHVNKTSCYTKQYVQQGKYPPINIQNFLILHVYTYLHSRCCLEVELETT